MAVSVKEIKDWLQQFPDDAFCYAYEGEIVTIVVVDREGDKQLGYLKANGPSQEFFQETRGH